MKKATIRQKLFAQEYCSNGYNAAKAALAAGYSENNVRQCASALLKRDTVNREIEKFRRKIEKRHMITIDQLIEELEEARRVALAAETPQSSAAISATMGKAKLHGLLVDKNEIKADLNVQVSKIEHTIIDPNATDTDS